MKKQEASSADFRATMTCCLKDAKERCALKGCKCFDALHDIKLFYVSKNVYWGKAAETESKILINLTQVFSACAGVSHLRCLYYTPPKPGGRTRVRVSTKTVLRA